MVMISKKLGLFVTILALIIGISSVSALAGESGMQADLDITLGATYLSGTTKYQIGRNVVWDNYGLEVVHFPISELDWPLDTFWATVRGELNLNRWRFGAMLQKNLTDAPGSMVDRDWGVYGYPFSHGETLDIYSESDTDLDAWIWDISADYTFYTIPQWSFYGGLGFTYQYFDFEGSNVKQWNRDPISGGDYYFTTVAGKVIEYEVTYMIPYMRVGTIFTYKDKMGTDRFFMEGSFAFSPMVDGEDEDKHLLRDKVNKSDTDGNAYIWALNARYNISPRWFLGLNFDYTKIDTEGTSRAEFDGPDSIYNHTIDIELHSTQTQTTFELGYDF